MYITPDTARELYALGFTYRHYARHPHRGMVYCCNGREVVLGGDVNEPLSPQEREMAARGMWLPSAVHLTEWLWDNDFVFSIVNTDGFFDVTCRDTLTDTLYQSKTPTLAAVVRKILKKRERPFDTKEKTVGICETNEANDVNEVTQHEGFPNQKHLADLV